jgi:hypothetical protein
MCNLERVLGLLPVTAHATGPAEFVVADSGYGSSWFDQGRQQQHSFDEGIRFHEFGKPAAFAIRPSMLQVRKEQIDCFPDVMLA